MFRRQETSNHLRELRANGDFHGPRLGGASRSDLDPLCDPTSFELPALALEIDGAETLGHRAVAVTLLRRCHPGPCRVVGVGRVSAHVVKKMFLLDEAVAEDSLDHGDAGRS